MNILGQFWFVLVHFESDLVLPKVGISKFLINNILKYFFEKLVRCRFFLEFLPKNPVLEFLAKNPGFLDKESSSQKYHNKEYK